MDHLIRFLFSGGRVRGQLVRLEGNWQSVAARHRQDAHGRNLPPNVRQRLGELSAAGLMLVSSLKFRGSLILQIQGPGPIPLIAVEARTNSTFRATLRTRPDLPLPQDASLADLVDAEGGARFAVTLMPDRDPEPGSPAPAHLTQPWQGIVPFEGHTVAEVLEQYMSRSEQLPTRLWLAADDQCAAGLLLQRVADHEAEGDDAEGEWETLQVLANTLTRTELLEQDPFTLARRLFHESGLRILDERSPSFACRCSRESVAAMLRGVGSVEVESILTEQGQVEVNCEFCSTTYTFDPPAARALFVSDEDDSASDPDSGHGPDSGPDSGPDEPPSPAGAPPGVTLH